MVTREFTTKTRRAQRRKKLPLNDFVVFLCVLCVLVVIFFVPMTISLADSYRYCEQVARREAGNFYHAFRVLPRAQRLAMCALYAFLRLTDDLGDCPGPEVEKRGGLADWRRQFER